MEWEICVACVYVLCGKVYACRWCVHVQCVYVCSSPGNKYIGAFWLSGVSRKRAQLSPQSV